MPESTVPAAILLPQISAQHQQSLTSLQAEFNSKIQKIDKLKRDVTAKKANLAMVRQRVQKEIQPLNEQLITKRVELVQLLDAAYGQPFFRKREKEKLATMLANLAYSLISNHGKTQLIPIHDKYAAHTYAETIAEARQEPAYTPPEPEPEPDIDWENLTPEEMQAQLDKKTAQREQQKQNRQKGRQTKAQLAKEARAKAELNNISKASRRVYTNLAKQLHPDTEQDEQVRAWKEEAMKKVTNAYHYDDFFELLRLQMEFMQQQQKPLHQLPEDQLSYYIKILDEQIKELQEELHEFKYGAGNDASDLYSGTPRQMDQKFKRIKEDLQLTLAHLKQELKNLQDDPQKIRLILKQVQ